MNSLFSIIKTSCLFKGRKCSTCHNRTVVYNINNLKSALRCFRQGSSALGDLTVNGTKSIRCVYRTKVTVKSNNAAGTRTPLWIYYKLNVKSSVFSSDYSHNGVTIKSKGARMASLPARNICGGNIEGMTRDTYLRSTGVTSSRIFWSPVRRISSL